MMTIMMSSSERVQYLAQQFDIKTRDIASASDRLYYTRLSQSLFNIAGKIKKIEQTKIAKHPRQSGVS